MIILDASSMVEWLQRSTLGLAVERHIMARGGDLHVPHLIDVEVTQALRKQVLLRAMTEERARRALQALFDAPIVRHELYPFIPRMWDLRTNLSAYDGLYIALAEFLGAPLLTCDSKIAAAPGHTAGVLLVP